jgi:transcriptional regulator with XRE-family HTH domain
MHSRKKTPVAALRLMLGLSAQEFASLIGKSISALTSLETGRLALSEETANSIARQTGVAVAWLLDGNSKQKPYVSTSVDGSREPYTKEHFERIQAAKDASAKRKSNPENRLIGAIATVTDWLSLYNKAEENGEGDLARYLMRNFLEELVERFGKDDDAFLRINAKARITNAEDTRFAFIEGDKGIALWLAPRDEKPLAQNKSSA